MSLTVTRTAAPAQTLALVLTPRHEQALDRLAGIYLRHRDTYSDPRSVQAYRWIAGVLSVDPRQLLLSEQDFQEHVRVHLIVLRDTILMAFDGSPLKEPMLFQNQVWEKWMLENRYDGQPNGAIPHQLFEDMIDWLASVTITTSAAAASSSLIELPSPAPSPNQINQVAMRALAGPQMEPARRIIYDNFIIAANKAQQNAQVAEFLNRKADLLERKFAELQIMLRESAERAVQREAEHEEALGRRIEELQVSQQHNIEMHEHTEELLRSCADDLRHQGQILQTELSAEEQRAKRLEAENDANKEAIRQLRIAYAEKARQFEALANRDRGRKGDCIII